MIISEIRGRLDLEYLQGTSHEGIGLGQAIEDVGALLAEVDRLRKAAAETDATKVAHALGHLLHFVADVRARRGRDFIRALPSGKTLDHIDSGKDPGARVESIELELAVLTDQVDRLRAEVAGLERQLDLTCEASGCGSCPGCDRLAAEASRGL